MAKDTGYDFVVIKAINKDNSSLAITQTRNVQNSVSMMSESGSRVYESVIAGSVTHGYIPCTGGDAVATAGNGTQRVTQTSEKTTKT